MVVHCVDRLCQTWSEIPKTGFLMTQLIDYFSSSFIGVNLKEEHLSLNFGVIQANFQMSLFQDFQYTCVYVQEEI